MVHVTNRLDIISTEKNQKSGNSLDKLCHPRSETYSAEQVLLNKQQIWCGGDYPDCYQKSY